MLLNQSHLSYIVMSPILSAVFALLNAVTIYIFCRHLRLSSLPLIALVNICMCDIFVCVISNTFYIVNLAHPVYAWSTGGASCKIFKFVTMLTNIAQIYFLCILNADRIRRLIFNALKQWKKRDGVLFVTIAWLTATIICVPRLILFDEKSISKMSAEENATIVVSFSCKPTGNKTMYTVITIAMFVVAYALPTMYILFSLIRSQVYMWSRRKQIHISSISNEVIKMNHKLAFMFNLTGALFLAIWTPFFVLTLVDLNDDLVKTEEIENVNFALRCSLLILGSAKPLIYIVYLDKFRNSFTSIIKNGVRRVSTLSIINTNKTKPTTKMADSSNSMNTIIFESSV
jgi:hypothetical protein